MNVLIVDDIAANRKLLRAILEAGGHRALDAADGVEALRVLGGEKVDAVVSDILMPKMDGYRLCHELRHSEQFAFLPFILYSATYSSPADRKLAADLGADKFIEKPAPAAQILAALAEVTAAERRVPPGRLHPPPEKELLEEYNSRLVAKLEDKALALERQTQALARTNAELQGEIARRERAEEERGQMGKNLEQVQQELVKSSRLAGMAEIATSVLHNVGNVLNSVNVASGRLQESLARSKAGNLSKVVALMREHQADLGAFLSADAKGQQIPEYLAQLAEHLACEQTKALEELTQLQKNIEHIKAVVTRQQNSARVSGVAQTLEVAELVEDALRINADSFEHHQIRIRRELQDLPKVTVDKSRVVQILVNLLRNAGQACQESGPQEKIVTVRASAAESGIRIDVCDTGCGIAAENLARLFARGFTTWKDGHGFGLHSAVLSAQEIGGSLSARSDGPGRGATFTLELPATCMRGLAETA